MLYASATNTLSKLTIGVGGTCLIVSGGLPVWGSCSGVVTTWDNLGDATGNGAIAMGTTEQTMDWDFTTTAHDGLTFNFDNNGGTAGTDSGLVINNAVSTNASGDLNTENLLLIQQLDTTGTGTTVVDNGLKIDVAANAGMTDGIEITNSGGNLTNGLNIVDTAGGTLATGLLMSGSITTGIDLTDTNIGTGISMGANDIVGTTGIINYNNFDVDASGNIDTTGTLTAGSGNEVLTLSTGKIDADALTLTTAADGGTGTSSGSGLEARSDGVGLLQGCADGQVLKWVESTDTWDCADDLTTPDTAVFLDTTPAAWADNNTTELFNDATKANITTNSADATVMVSIHIRGTASNTTADAFLAARVVYTNDQTNPTCSGGTQVGEPMIGGFTTNTTHPWQVSGTFLHTPSTTGEEIRYTVCTSTESVGTATDTPEDVRISLVELGADLAENYYTTDSSIGPGTVVAIDSSLPAGIKKTTGAYDNQAIGVVATAPGIVLDDATGLGYGTPLPVALAGRIPVLVSTENGRVKAGDLLTSSSVPGIAMKATKAGQVIGQALQDFSYPDGEVGLVVTFVKTDYANGSRVEDLIPGLREDTGLLETASIDKGRVILAHLLGEKTDLESNTVSLSEITTDRVTAGLEIITPKITTETIAVDKLKAATGLDIAMSLAPEGTFTIGNALNEIGISFDGEGNAFFSGTVSADTVVAEKILGLEIFTKKLSQVDDSVADLEQQLQTLNESQAEMSLADLGISGNGQSGLTFTKEVDFTEVTLFRRLATFMGEAVFQGKVFFQGTPTFNQDTAGYAVISEGTTRVMVEFENEYQDTPVVNASLLLGAIDDAEVRDAAEELLLVSEVHYIITNVTTKGFEIRINQAALIDVRFAWQALAVKEPKVFGEESAPLVVEEPEPVVIEDADSPEEADVQTGTLEEPISLDTEESLSVESDQPFTSLDEPITPETP
jgi:hypothetical protein